MTNEERKPTNLLNSASELRRLIIENPDLPLLVFAGEDANPGNYWGYMSCSYVSAHVGEFLDCAQTVNDEKCYCDRDDFEEDLEYILCDNCDMGEEEFEERFPDLLKQELAKYEPYWKSCIILYVNN